MIHFHLLYRPYFTVEYPPVTLWSWMQQIWSGFWRKIFWEIWRQKESFLKNMLMCKLHCTICLHMHDRLIDVSPLFVCSNWQLYWYLHYYTPLPTLLTVVYVCTVVDGGLMMTLLSLEHGFKSYYYRSAQVKVAAITMGVHAEQHSRGQLYIG